jgi:hypothetical protein
VVFFLLLKIKTRLGRGLKARDMPGQGKGLLAVTKAVVTQKFPFLSSD